VLCTLSLIHALNIKKAWQGWEKIMQREIAAEHKEQWNSDLEQKVREALREIRYGTVTLVIQDSRVIQIDKSEKIRLK
jgi:hypothetical protein